MLKRAQENHSPDTRIKISVVVTVRNEIRSIRSVVDSLLNQDRIPDEIIIVDGVSDDGTLSVLEEYAGAGRIILISQACNIAEGRNLGIARASHDFIAVTDAGCVIDPGWLKNMEACFIKGDAEVIAGNYVFDTRTPFERAVVLATESPDRENTESARYFPSSRSVAFDRTAWAAVKGYPEWLYAAEDTLFNIRLRQLGFRFRFCRDAKVIWRPRATWQALFKQYFNYARGNGRVGISTAGYLTNLKYHGLMLLFILTSVFWAGTLLLAGLIFARHVQLHLWRQADIAVRTSGDQSMRWRVLVVMEVVRLAGMAGFLAGRWDRWRDVDFVNNQLSWMGVSSLDDISSSKN
ncbi:glycosyltransferase [Methylococcus sp. EFPC2]|uniref:glycosyltransferase n=1 Tax=Methylococcus sp. EFPC2 TaxID=2812648 RepID=UPI00196735F6|nr:glycosyltransferase [Methylococcus sp. EFPC2]QSA98438.1 glycosyltransferase [Methylococcus sp. EFPC2]